MSTTENNPVVVSIDNQLANLRQDLKSNIASIKRQIQITLG